MCKHKRKIEEEKKAKMHFWSLYFGFIFILVPNLISHLSKSQKTKNHVHFGPCRQPTNRKCICAKLGKQFRGIRHQRLCLKINLHIHKGILNIVKLFY